MFAGCGDVSMWKCKFDNVSATAIPSGEGTPILIPSQVLSLANISWDPGDTVCVSKKRFMVLVGILDP
jgi:hypothetical protein